MAENYYVTNSNYGGRGPNYLIRYIVVYSWPEFGLLPMWSTKFSKGKRLRLGIQASGKCLKNAEKAALQGFAWFPVASFTESACYFAEGRYDFLCHVASGSLSTVCDKFSGLKL